MKIPASPLRRRLAALVLAALAAVLPPGLRAVELQQQEPAGYTSRIDGPGNEEIYDSCTDAAGNVYVVGRFSSTQVTVDVLRDLPERLVGGADADVYRFGPATPQTFTNGQSNSSYDLFVIKYDKDGNVVWRRVAGGTTGTQHDVATGVAVNASGQVFITGVIDITAPSRFGALTVPAKAGYNTADALGSVYTNLFVAMLDVDGNWAWVKPFEFTTYESLNTNALPLGAQNIEADFRLQSDGNNRVSTAVGITNASALRGANSSAGHALALGPDGSVYIKGSVETSVFNGAAGPSNLNEIVWLKGVGGGQLPLLYAQRLSANSVKHVLYTGTPFVAKLAATPPAVGTTGATTYAWSWMAPVTASAFIGADPTRTVSGLDTTGTGGGNDFYGPYGFGVSSATLGNLVADDDSVYLTGTWQGNHALSGVAGTTPLSPQDGFVARLRSGDGSPVYLSGYSAATANTTCAPGALALDAQRNVYVTGAINNASGSPVTTFRGRTVTDGNTFSAAFAVASGSQNVFVGKLNGSGRWQWTAAPTLNLLSGGSTPGNLTAWATSLTRDPAGALYVGGSLVAGYGDLNLDFGNGIRVIAGDNGGSPGFLVKLTDATGVRQWRWALQTPRIAGTPAFNVADVRSGLGGTVYWSLNGGVSGNLANSRSPIAADTAYDGVAGRGAFLLPILEDTPNLSPAFSSFNQVVCGQEVPVPDGAFRDANNKPLLPEITLPGSTTSALPNFHWDTFSAKLYAVSPVTAEVRWRVYEDPANLERLKSRVVTRWPRPEVAAEGLVTQISGAGADHNEPAVTLEPPGLNYTFSNILYTDNNAVVAGAKLLRATADVGQEGHVVLLYAQGKNKSVGSAPVALTVVRTLHWSDPRKLNFAAATVGTPLNGASFGHDDPLGRNGFLVNRLARIDANGPAAAYGFDTQLGPIIPVNVEETTGTAPNVTDATPDDDLNVIWTSRDVKGVGWPSSSVRYTAAWPTNPERIVIASQLGSEMDGQGPATAALAAGLNAPATLTAADGTVYAGDSNVNPSPVVGGAIFTNAVTITNTADQALYQRGRAGADFTYTLSSVANGNYLVTLHLSEPQTGPSAPGQRTMNVSLNGTVVLPNFSTLERAGNVYNRAVVVTLPVTVTTGTLAIRFQKVASATQALVNGLKVAPAVPQELLDPARFGSPTIYHQPDATLAGYNPNEEHALLAPPNLPQGTTAAGRLAVFALRNDLNHVGRRTSEPYALVRYQDLADGLKTKFKVYRVEVADGRYSFNTFTAVAGTRLLPPYPLSLLNEAAGTTGSGVPYFKDRKNQVWAKCDGAMVGRYFYPLQGDFWYDVAAPFGTRDPNVTEVPWLDRYNRDVRGELVGGVAPVYGTLPVPVNYTVSWPPSVPTLAVGDTLTSARDNLPDVEKMSSATVIYEQSNAGVALTQANTAVRILDYTAQRVVPLGGTPAPVVNGQNLVVGALTFAVERDLSSGSYRFSNLPFHLKSRLEFAPQGYVDPVSQLPVPALILGGYKDGQSYAGRPLLLPNILSFQERNRLLDFDNTAGNTGTAWDTAVEALFRLSRNPGALDLDGTAGADNAHLAGFAKTGNGPLRHADVLGPKALTAGKARGTLGYVTLVENNAADLGAAPIALHILRVVNPPVTGDLKVIFSDNPLDEKITVRHGADFAGDAGNPADPTAPDTLSFEWWIQSATTATSPAPPVVTNGAAPGWVKFAEGTGVNDVTIEGASLRTLSDSWVYCRYKGYGAGVPANDATAYGNFAGDPSGTIDAPRAAFVPGWIKRVLSGLNPFEARVKNFASAPTQTYASALISAGTRYEGDVALSNDADNLNSLGLISLYETVLRRGLKLSINGSGQTNAAVNQSLLLAATRISDLYMLWGNEAYADAQDPTVGFTTASGEVGSLAPSVFAFQNQVPSLIAEELSLLRGRDDSSAGIAAAPVYNRLFWNFTKGLEGEPAYVQNYGLNDQNADGFINETDARIRFPQGHGDAWGHYLSATKGHYRLLRHPLYTWNPNSESTLIAGVAVEVDYSDERKFAAAAAAKATAGAEIVNLTYRNAYTADPAGQWQGYRETDRAWGVDDWARRAGQAAYLDWVAATAILPADHAHVWSNPTTLPPVDNPSQLTPTATPPEVNYNSGPTPQGLQKIDRGTVTELARIASAFGRIQAQMDGADGGLNPLGVTPGTIPFDVDPTVGNGENTHFEQVFARAMKAMANARGVFDYANELTNRLRQTQLSADEFAQDVREQEYDFNSRLIEIFGYPYAGDIGSGKAYPTGYGGPDLYHYNYVAVNAVSGTAVVPDTHFDAVFLPFGQEFKAPAGGATNANDLQQVYSHYFPTDNTPINPVIAGTKKPITFPVATAASWSFAAPPDWGVRRAPGTLQLAIGDMVRAEAELRRGLLDYNNHLASIDDQVQLLFARSGLQASNIQVLNKRKNTIIGLNAAIGISRAVATATGLGAELLEKTADGAAEAIPKSVGLATDAFAPIRGAVKLAGAIGYGVLKLSGTVSTIAGDAIELSKEQVGLATDIEIQKNDYAYEVQEQLKVIEALLREDAGLRLDLFNLQNSLRDAAAQYQTVLAEGDRLLGERLNYRRKVAGVTQQNRYQDLAFRVFRNDALQKYRAAFDLAARYAYLAATTYDYETVQLDTNNAAGRRFLTDIVRERALGQFNGDGDPVVGVNGLSDPLARLKQNFEVLKTRLGINNPQFEAGQFSLRNENFRILPGDPAAWQDQLQSLRVPDLWAVPEFRRFCRPFAPESAGAQPGLVIPFTTNVNFGLNFFGQLLGGGDSSYDSTNFATKIKGVGVSFTGYNGTGLSNTPRVYLVPVGLDILRAPDDAALTTRKFDVVDQAIPVPFPVGTAALQNPKYIPSNDSLDSPFNQIRQFSRFRAYADNGLDAGQLVGDTRLIGRSVWNTKWLLIVPGGTLLNNATDGLDTFVLGAKVPGSTTVRDGNGITDIKLFFETYSYSGN